MAVVCIDVLLDDEITSSVAVVVNSLVVVVVVEVMVKVELLLVANMTDDVLIIEGVMAVVGCTH